MAKNLEYKVQYEALNRILPKLRILGATHQETIHQVDTYFNCAKGRLKLRETDNADEGWLIFYERPNETVSRYSLYQLCKIAKGSTLRELLTAALHVKTVVKKERSVWMYKNTRIHLDRVDALGEYVELETVFQGQTEADAITEHDHVKHTLELNIAESIAVSYSDLSIQKTKEEKHS